MGIEGFDMFVREFENGIAGRIRWKKQNFKPAASRMRLRPQGTRAEYFFFSFVGSSKTEMSGHRDTCSETRNAEYVLRSVIGINACCSRVRSRFWEQRN